MFGMTREDCVFAWAVLGFSGPNWALPRLYWALLVPIGPYEGLTGPILTRWRELVQRTIYY